MLIYITSQLNAVSVWQEGATYRWESQAGVVADVPAADVLAASKTLRLFEIRKEAAAVIEADWPTWKQNNCSLGVYPEATTAQCADDIAAVIAASNTAEDAVDAATTVAEVEAVTPSWPVI